METQIKNRASLTDASNKDVQIIRMHNGIYIEIYPTVSQAKTAITQGYQPQRDLRYSDKPVD